MDIVTFSLITLVFILCISFIVRKKRNLPDGIPKIQGGLPWIGNAFQVNKPLALMLQDWAKKYGSLFIMKLFGEDIMVVASDDGMKEGLVTSSTDFAGRPDIWRVNFVNDNKGQFAFGDCSTNFLKRKKTVMTILKRHYKVLHKLEELSVNAILELVDTFKSYEGKPFDPIEDVHRAVSSIMLSLLFGGSLNETKLTKFMELDNVMGTVATGEENIIFDIAPWTRFFLRDRYKKLKDFRRIWNEWLTSLIDGRKESVRSGDPAQCIVDNILQEINKTPDEDGSFIFIENDVFPVIRDLIIAGVDTSSSTMNSMLALLAMNQDCQKKIQRELDDCLGGAEPNLDHRSSLHYMEATILELLRYTSIAPFMVPHRAQVDTSLQGHKIPKDMTVWFCLFSVHHDEKYFSDPYSFKPERFLDEEGKLIAPDHEARTRMYAFGAGRRICPGADLARNRIFLLSTWLLQRFTFFPPEGEDINTDPRDFRMSSLPNHIKHYKLRAIPRSA